jgi:hypothetical protein
MLLFRTDTVDERLAPFDTFTQFKLERFQLGEKIPRAQTPKLVERERC